jgi:hypothetical protein
MTMIENFGGGGFAGHSGIIGVTDWAYYPYLSYLNDNQPMNNYQNYLDSQTQGSIPLEKFKYKSKKRNIKYIYSLIIFILFVYIMYNIR